jgi:threonine dehydrogenase-like Zn-dependent dehydrogenase
MRGKLMIRKGKAAILDKPNGEFTIDEAELPEPKEGEMLVKQEMCGVCGTDVHMYHGHLPGTRFPIVLGHEPVGIIARLGKGVKVDHAGEPVQEGDRIYVVPGLRCGKCYFCTVLLEPTLCVNSTAYGFRPYLDQPPHFQGGYAEYIYMNHPVSTFLKMHVPPEIAVLLEPLTVGIHQVDKARLRVGDTAVIQGCGAIGLSTLAAAKETGAYKTIVIGAPKSRLDLAKEFGADLTINIEEVTDPKERIEMVKSETAFGYGADVVFECTGFPKAIPEGIDMLRRGGSYVVAGHFTDVGNVPLNPFLHFTNKQINLVGVWGDDIGHFVRGRPILESGKYPFGKMVSHKLPLERVKDAMNAISTNYRLDEKEVMKIVIET